MIASSPASRAPEAPESSGPVFSPMALPKGINTFARPAFPADPVAPATLEAVIGLLGTFAARLDALCEGGAGSGVPVFDFGALAPDVAALANDVLGQGEVSAVAEGAPRILIQETAFAGLWRVIAVDGKGAVVFDHLDIAPFPRCVAGPLRAAATGTLPDPGSVEDSPGIAGILSELRGPLEARLRESEALPYVVTLSLLPVRQEDLHWMAGAFGAGPVVILSRGYGNCRISSTRVPNLWWVQYFNSEDKMILNTLEVATVPDAAQAAPEDLEASASRLRDWAKDLTVS